VLHDEVDGHCGAETSSVRVWKGGARAHAQRCECRDLSAWTSTQEPEATPEGGLPVPGTRVFDLLCGSTLRNKVGNAYLIH
jgi:hypothetical protein